MYIDILGNVRGGSLRKNSSNERKDKEMTTDKIKKEFQKTISAIRKEMNDQFPKAMMTGQQMAKRTATVNCGGEWRTEEYSLKMAKAVATDPRFIVFLAECDANAKIEANSFGGYQIRIYY